MTKERKAARKPLSFSTTLRSPERIAGFIKCLLPFEGTILSNDVIHEVVVSLIEKKFYYTQKYEMKVLEYKEIYNNDDLSFTREQVEDIINNSPQEHKEAGFDKGWPSRFDTWYEFPQELGFVKYEIGKPLIISQTGHMLVDAFNEQQPNNEKIQAVFLNALMKYQTNNPFKKNLNENRPLILLLQVINKLKEMNEKSKGVSRRELPLFVCWPNSNYCELVDKILDLRKIYKYQISDEIIYDECMVLLEAGDDKKNLYKISKITTEAVDEFIRKMRITGIFSLRGNGRFLDINNYEKNIVDYILANYSNKNFILDKDEYFKYVSNIDPKIIGMKKSEIPEKNVIKEQSLIKWAQYFKKEEIENELKLLYKKLESKNEILRVIDKPTRFEFLISMSLKQHFSHLKVIPNYKVDDEGLPTFTASGGKADIECFDNNSNPIIEVTLMNTKAQAVNEIPAITRHLDERKKLYKDKRVYALFIAPIIHADTNYMIGYSKYQKNIDIIAYTILEYINTVNMVSNIDEMQ